MERPILFNTDMVKAILKGRKTQTRRIIKPQPTHNVPMGFIFASGSKKDLGKFMFGDSDSGYTKGADYYKPPYQVGDTIWVRETWCNINKPGIEPEYYYYADAVQQEDFDQNEWKWKPSIHMPRAAARLFLKVTDVRVERLQDITGEDAEKEGCKLIGYDVDTGEPIKDITLFKINWDSIYHNWDENPWVWVIEFEKLSGKEKLLESYIEKHENGSCDCDVYNKGLCLGGMYLGGNLTKEEIFEDWD